MPAWPGPQGPWPSVVPGLHFPWSPSHTFVPRAVFGPRPCPPIRAGPWADSAALGAAVGRSTAAAVAPNEEVEVEEVEEVEVVGMEEMEEGEDDLDPWGMPWRPTPAKSTPSSPTAAWALATPLGPAAPVEASLWAVGASPGDGGGDADGAVVLRGAARTARIAAWP